MSGYVIFINKQSEVDTILRKQSLSWRNAKILIHKFILNRSKWIRRRSWLSGKFFYAFWTPKFVFMLHQKLSKSRLCQHFLRVLKQDAALLVNRDSNVLNYLYLQWHIFVIIKIQFPLSLNFKTLDGADFSVVSMRKFCRFGLSLYIA